MRLAQPHAGRVLIAGEAMSARYIGRALIDAANAGGGPDNITVILAAIR
jgi:hypothetical protein